MALRAICSSLDTADAAQRQLHAKVKDLAARATYERSMRNKMEKQLDEAATEKLKLKESLAELQIKCSTEGSKAADYKSKAERLERSLASEKANYVQAAASAAEAKKVAKSVQKELKAAQKAKVETETKLEGEAERLQEVEEQLSDCQGALDAARELSREKTMEAEAACEMASDFNPPPQPNWEHLSSLSSSRVRLSEARRRDVRYLTHILTCREWRSQEVAAALDEAALLNDVMEEDICV
eukprot:2723113-Pleurochrysis_carterae.AAC.1